jgi:hypothetical protein
MKSLKDIDSKQTDSNPANSHFVTIDTGASGAICIVTDTGEFKLIPLKGLEPAKILPLLNQAVGYTDNLQKVIIEEPPRFMGTMIPSSRISVLFESFGIMIGYLMANGIEPRRVQPRIWQEMYRDALDSKRGKMKHSEWKKILSQYAKIHYPTNGLTNQTTDALLMAHWWLTHGKKTSNL